MHIETALKTARALGAAYLRIACGKIQVLSDKYQVLMEVDADKAASMAGLKLEEIPESLFLDIRTIDPKQLWNTLKK